jgi:hypothetical protein
MAYSDILSWFQPLFIWESADTTCDDCVNVGFSRMAAALMAGALNTRNAAVVSEIKEIGDCPAQFDTEVSAVRYVYAHRCPDNSSEKPDLSHLRAFGSLVTSRVSGDRPASSIATRSMASFSATRPPISTCGTLTRLRVASRRLVTLFLTKLITCPRSGHPDLNSYMILV